MWQKIKANTMLFIILVGFVKIFELIFTPSNTLVGVAVIITLLVLMSENLTEKSAHNFKTLLIINFGQGIMTYIASHYIELGFIINFIALSSIGYLLSAQLNKTMILPFGLQYLFMLYTPVSVDQLGQRLLALGFGAVCVMVSQLIIYRKSKAPHKQGIRLINMELYQKQNEDHSVRAAYAIRIGLITAITAFAVSFFHIEQGRWIVYTVFALTELYSENCRTRSKERLEGTIIGAFLILVLFTFIKETALRVIIILLAGYLDSYTSNYRDKMICVTVSVIASASLASGTLFTATERILCVIVGILLALTVDLVIFRKKFKKCSIE